VLRPINTALGALDLTRGEEVVSTLPHMQCGCDFLSGLRETRLLEGGKDTAAWIVDPASATIKRY